MFVECLTVGPLAENCWLVADEGSREAVLVDPGDEPERLLAALDAHRFTLRAIWLTHAHFDHVGAVAEVVRQRPVPVYLHPADAPMLAFAAQSAARWQMAIEQPPPADRTLADGDVLHLGALRFDVLFTPGHSPGHVSIVGEGHCFSGDCLFVGSIGRTDLPLSNPAHMQAALERLAALPPSTIVHPGHGPATSIGEEMLVNPFMSGAARVLGA
ncbi:MAG: MBL fold metallo-hydrolase [Gemmatimonadetes bacterium]|nr:MBL fold metallo-hydrolase [Gemmatimonadota bacterium]